MMPPEPTGVAVGACRPTQSLKNSVINAIGLGHPKAVIKVIRLPVLTAIVSSCQLLAGAAVLVGTTRVRKASTGRVRSVRRSPLTLFTCPSIAAATTRPAASADAVEVFAPSQTKAPRSV